MPAGDASESRSLNPFRALFRHRNFRRFWIGQTASFVGSWMQTVAQSWLALELTNDAFMVGLVGAASQIPVLVLSLFAGALADRYPKLRLVLIAQTLLLLNAAALWWFVWSGVITIGWLLAFAAVSGVINALDIPARQALMVELVGHDDLLDAVALNSTGFNLARILGPALAAGLIAKAGLAWCFAVNALSFGAVIAGLSLIRLPRASERRPPGSPLLAMWRGIVYLTRTHELSILMSMIAVVTVLGSPYLVLLPVFARDVLHSDASTYGALLTCVGVGAIAAAISLAAVGRRLRRGRLLSWSAFAFGALLLAFAASRSILVAGALLVGVGFAMVATNILANTILQGLVRDEMRGRVMAAYAFVFIGFAPFGQLLGGALARRVGAHWAIGATAVAMMLYTGWAFSRHREIAEIV